MAATTHLTPSAPAARRAIRPFPGTSRLARRLALLGPVLLFGYGILDWLRNGAAVSPAWTDPAAVGCLVVASTVLTLLAAELGELTGTGPLAIVSVVLTAFGAGVTGSVAVGTAVGLLSDDAPGVLTVGGPVLLVGGLVLLLVRFVRIGALPATSALLAALGLGTMLAPWGLLPLGALALLAGLLPVIAGEDEERPEGLRN